MRKFGNDAPEFLAFTLGESETVYKLPLAASLPVIEVIELQEATNLGGTAALRFQLELLERYGVPTESLTAGDVGAIYKAWNAASTEQGATVGES